MDYFKSKNSYQEIDPIPQRGRKKFLHYVLIGAFTLCIGSIMVLVLVNTFASPAINLDIVPSNASSGGGNILRASAPGDTASPPEDSASAPVEPVKVAPAPVQPTPNEPVQVVQETVDSTPGVKVSPGNAAENNIPTEPPLEDILLELDQGPILGKRMTSRAGREYLGFLGIPYAKPPLGELRFMPPVEPAIWNGTLNATQFQPDCLQKDKYNPEIVTKGSEDCLYINIYTPKTLADLQKGSRRSGRYPVMVYIHGGGQFGSATRYGADYFMDEDVVLVTLHYRLGILGNLNTNDSEARGNQGLKDQVMALQWVQDNIKKFGGSKRKVTIFGNSFGGMDVSAHMLSPMSKGLFKQVICQSGVQIMPEILTKNPLGQATKLGKKLNCVGNTTKEIVSCFRKTDAKEIILSSYLMEFATSIEPPADTDDVFLPDIPINILQDGQLNRASAMFGVASGEGLTRSLPILSSPNLTRSFNENWEVLAGQALQLNHSMEQKRITNLAREFYLGSNNLSREVETNLTALFSDRQFTHPANVFANFQIEKNRRRDNVYLYYFNEDAGKSYSDPVVEAYGTDKFLGAGHADELQFLFPYDPYPVIPLGSKYANFSQMMVRLWVSFANNGEPTGASNGAEWLPIENEKPYKWFELSQDKPGMIDILGERMNFWDAFNLTDLYGLYV